MNPRILPRTLALLALLGAATATHAAELTITTTQRETGETIPARIHLAGPDGKPVKAAGNLPFWNDHISSPGSAAFDVAPGRYSVTVERGPEWSSESTTVEIAAGQTATNLQVALKRLVNLSAEGWWAGEMHIHRPIDQVELLMRAEDLHFGQLLSWWNAANPWTNAPLPSPGLKQFDGNRFVHQLGGEDERDGGALLFFGLDRPIDITAGNNIFRRRSAMRNRREPPARGSTSRNRSGGTCRCGSRTASATRSASRTITCIALACIPMRRGDGRVI
jgi:hypothetical protein